MYAFYHLHPGVGWWSKEGTGILNNDIQKEGVDFHNGSLRRKEYSRYAR